MAWIDSKHALFDLSTLPESAVSRDLFNELVLVERSYFMAAQAEALVVEQKALLEDGWSNVVITPRGDAHDRLMSMDEAPQEYDEPTTKKLAKIEERWETLEAKITDIDEADETALQAHQEKLEALEAEADGIKKDAPIRYAETTKATVFLLLRPDGQMKREYRVPRRKGNGGIGQHGGNGHETGHDAAETALPPTSDDLSDRQLSTTFHQQALAVREALLANMSARKRILALILYEKVRSDALMIRHEANGTTLHATSSEGFSSPAFDRLSEKRAAVDPFKDQNHVDDTAGYTGLAGLSDSQLNTLIALLTVDCLSAHPVRQTKLIHQLAAELKVNLRDHSRPDVAWLTSYKKIQLAHLITELKGAVNAPSPERKKSELVDLLATLFTDAAEGKLEDKKLAERLNCWLPSNLRGNTGTENGT